tara:strand:+ start:83198 stop:83941 length:744 start_codon:yes stop_codon:yes gene_type:complete
MRTQHQFTQYIRNPKTAPVPGDIEQRRMDLYCDFLFTNISNFLAENFPVLKKIMSEQQWEELSRDFFSRHSSHSPYFSQISQEFLRYLQSERLENPQSKHDLPFLLELAHYEWTELVMSIAEDVDSESSIITDPLAQALTLSDTALALAYQYPVHKISPSFIPTEPPAQPSYLVVYRNVDDQIVFLETNPITHALLETLADNTEQATLSVLSKLADDMQHPNPDTLIQGGLSILNDFISRGIIISAQ